MICPGQVIHGYAVVLYDPIYAAFGIAAMLTPNRPAATGVAVSVIERTRTTDASEEFDLELDGGMLVFASRICRIDARVPRPGPDGDTSGEIQLYLTDV